MVNQWTDEELRKIRDGLDHQRLRCNHCNKPLIFYEIGYYSKGLCGHCHIKMIRQRFRRTARQAFWRGATRIVDPFGE